MINLKEKNLVWIDLEMTGLCPEKDYILEIATIITDSQLNIIAQQPSLIIHNDPENLKNMSEWVKTTHSKSGLLDAVAASKLTLLQAERETLDFLRQYCVPEKSPLCGNSIWQDRAFLRLHMPKIYDFLHYRIIDVSSFKEVIKRWYPRDGGAEYKKKDAHRALDDIIESIEELKYYRSKFFI